MLDIGWFEMAVVGILLLVVVGPKDLPKVLRTVGYWTGKARSMAREFQRSLDQYVKEAELEDVKKGVDKLNVRKTIQNTIDPKGAIKKELSETDKALRQSPNKANGAAASAAENVDPTTPEPKSETPTDPAPEPETTVATPSVTGTASEAKPANGADQGGEEPRKAQAGGAR